MKDSRTPFYEALEAFRRFAGDNDRPTDFIWISQDRVCVVGCRVWIFRPNEIQGDKGAASFYESSRAGDCSLKLLGICALGDGYLACVERMPSPPHDPYHLYMSLHENPPYRIRIVASRILWILIRLVPNVSRRNQNIREGLSLYRTMKTA